MKRNIKIIFLVLLTFLFVPTISAVEHLTTDEYYEYRVTPNPIISSSDVKKLEENAIPSEYSLALGESFDSATGSGNVQMSDDEIDKWGRAGSDYENAIKSSYYFVTVMDDSIKGKYSMRYTNIGEYNGKNVDVKLTVIDYKESNDKFPAEDLQPYMLFSKKTMMFNVMKVEWVVIKYEFFESGTNTPISVKGYTNYWDIDLQQGVHMLEGTKNIYTTRESKLNYTSINGVPYVYATKEEPVDFNCEDTVYDKRGSFTETFEGSQMTKLFYAKRESGSGENAEIRAFALYANSAIVSTAIKSYARDSKVKNNDIVKVGDIIKYSIKYTNGDAEREATVKIVDKLSKGLKYKAGSASIGEPTISSDGLTLTWNTSLQKGSTGVLTYEVEVVPGYEEDKVYNGATATIGDIEYELDILTNKLEKIEEEIIVEPPKTVKVPDTKKYNYYGMIAGFILFVAGISLFSYFLIKSKKENK